MLPCSNDLLTILIADSIPYIGLLKSTMHETPMQAGSLEFVGIMVDSTTEIALDFNHSILVSSPTSSSIDVIFRWVQMLAAR